MKKLFLCFMKSSSPGTGEFFYSFEKSISRYLLMT